MTRTERAKSTVSVHLRELVADGVLGSRNDPDDGRRRSLPHSGRSPRAARGRRTVRCQSRAPPRRFNPANPDPPSSTASYSARPDRAAQRRRQRRPILHAAEEGSDAVLGRTFANLTTSSCSNPHRVLEPARAGPAGGRIDGPARPRRIRLLRVCAPAVPRSPRLRVRRGLLTAHLEGHYEGAATVEETACYAMGSGCCRLRDRTRSAEERRADQPDRRSTRWSPSRTRPTASRCQLVSLDLVPG